VLSEADVVYENDAVITRLSKVLWNTFAEYNIYSEYS